MNSIQNTTKVFSFVVSLSNHDKEKPLPFDKLRANGFLYGFDMN
ncbi:hypothetical protein [Moraxella lacunata]